MRTALFLIGNVISIIHIVYKKPVKTILEPDSNGFQSGNPYLIFLVSQLIEGMPYHIPMPFKCYERALTARFVFNVLKVKSVFYIGFNPKAATRTEKLHAWLETDIGDVCGFTIKDRYVVLEKYA
ncbi:lasso peptide biosynthesis protein [Dyadobacter sediminis]